ncbi:hypothetical protein K438DRAFT_1986749 [Mycena galopus ATCC 62051]|nr:hypothetical protein K438DRAFT_1986749 [Mycena galopus ATCC 62051]
MLAMRPDAVGMCIRVMKGAGEHEGWFGPGRGADPETQSSRHAEFGIWLLARLLTRESGGGVLTDIGAYHTPEADTSCFRACLFAVASAHLELAESESGGLWSLKDGKRATVLGLLCVPCASLRYTHKTCVPRRGVSARAPESQCVSMQSEAFKRVEWAD